jgi:hypothetical protein
MYLKKKRSYYPVDKICIYCGSLYRQVLQGCHLCSSCGKSQALTRIYGEYPDFWILVPEDWRDLGAPENEVYVVWFRKIDGLWRWVIELEGIEKEGISFKGKSFKSVIGAKNSFHHYARINKLKYKFAQLCDGVSCQVMELL